jgi:hypothetical protein
MRSGVNRFSVEVRDIYGDARSSVTAPGRRRWPLALLTTTAAIAIGAAVGWMMAVGISAPTSIPTAAGAEGGLSAEPRHSIAALQATEPVARPSAVVRIAGRTPAAARIWHLVTGEAVAPRAVAGWPIVLHRAGDGRFYTDLTLDGHLVNILVDPASPVSRLMPALLPDGILPTDAAMNGGEGEALEVILEHLRLPPTRFSISDETLEAVIGADLLARHFIVEEQFDRLRLVPRSAGI